MKELQNFCKQLKQNFTPKNKDPDKPVKTWSEKDIIDNNIVDTFVIILRTQGCTWAHDSGCTMCGYYNDTMWEHVSEKNLLKQFKTAMESFNNQKFVKIFTSGSFLDEQEIPTKVFNKIITKLAKQTDRISVESRPEYITDAKLKDIKKITDNFEIGIGLETANDFIREHCINKGFSYSDYKKAADLLTKYMIRLKTYVLIKPPFLTEKESIQDAVSMVDKIKDFTDIISFNPVNVQKNTLVEFLWKRNQYRPPWLFSIVKILEESKKIVNNSRLKCDVAGGGSIRGAHNCKDCNNKYLKAISKFSLSQKINVFKNLECECKEKWFDQLEIENLGFGSLVDMYR